MIRLIGALLLSLSGIASAQELQTIDGMPGQGLDMTFTVRHGPTDEGYKIEILAFTAKWNPKAEWNRVETGEQFTMDVLVFARENCEKCRVFYEERIDAEIPFETGQPASLEEPVEVTIPWAVYNDADEFLLGVESDRIAFLFDEKILKPN